MKIEELSIGDWVLCDGEYWKISRVGLRVDSDYTVASLEECDPIPLTPEILEKNGFNKFSECGWRNLATKCFLYRYGIKYWDITINGGNRTYRPTRIRIENILHTHQLQHALRLAGIDKEIEL